VCLGDIPLENAIHSALSKGLNFAVFPSVLPIDYILRSVENIHTLPDKAAEEIGKETVSILKRSKKSRNNLERLRNAAWCCPTSG
jgi:hypothetical protein